MLSKEQMDKVSVSEMLRKFNVEHTQSGDYIKVRCNHPAHKDNTPSCNFFRDTKTFRCFSCGTTGNLVEYLRRHAGLNYADVEKQICDHYGLRRKHTNSTPALAEALAQELLSKRPQYLMDALKARCVNDEQLLIYQIGFDRDTGRLTIPYYDIDYNLLYIKSYMPGDKAGNKMKIETKWNNCSGRQGTQILYPCEQLRDFDTLVLFGGEMKALAAIPILNPGGIGSVSKGGEKIPIHPSQYPDLKGKTIIVCMDSDSVGKDAQNSISQKLSRDGLLHDFKVATLDLPLSGLPDEKDVNDYLRLGNTDLWELAQKAAIENVVDPQPEHVSLDSMETIFVKSLDKLKTGRFYEFETSVVKSQCKSHRHLESMALVCPTMGYCESCPLHVGMSKEKVIVQTKTIGESKLVLMKGSPIQKKDEIRMIMPVNCMKATLAGHETTPVMRCNLEGGERAYIVGDNVDIREGVKYRMKGEYLLDADGSCFWIYQSEQISFKVDDNRLTRFKVATPTVESVKQKLTEIGSHLVHVTGMGNQLFYHIWLDLALHSSISFTDFDGTKQVGGVSMLTIGDTGTGKSRSYEKLLGYLDFPVGQYVVNGTDVTIPGLIGAINMNGANGPTIGTGAILRRKDRMMIVNEAHRLKPDVINKFSDLMSSNQITIDKAINASYDASTRMIFFGNPVHANPVNNWKVSAYNNRAEIFVRSFKNPEFLRRLTYCYIMGEPEIKMTYQGVESFTQVEMQNRLWAAWERVPTLKCDPALVRNLAGKLNVTFSTMAAPYFDGNYTRVKLLQVSVAIANATCSSEVLDCHVEVAYDLLERSYNENMGLGDYAINSNSFDEAGAKRALFKCENREALVQLILRHDTSMDWRQLQSYIEPFNFRAIICGELAGIGAWNNDPLNKGHIVFNPMFLSFLREVKWEQPKFK